MRKILYLTADRFNLHDWINNKNNQKKYEYKVERFSEYYTLHFDKKDYKNYYNACTRFDKVIKKYIQETFSEIFIWEEDAFYKALNSWLDKDNTIIVNETKENVVYFEILHKALENKFYYKEHYTDKDIDICI